MITMPHIFLSCGGTAGEDNLQGFDENYWQDDGAGTPLKRSFIHLMAAGAASRAAKTCDTPGSSTKLTGTPWAHSALAKRFVTCGSTVVSAEPWAIKTGAPAGA